ncbi:MAG: 3'-5' exonuclease [Leptospira sp.]|nr:3'-5' exonuclease [Leptospira sp.]
MAFFNLFSGMSFVRDGVSFWKNRSLSSLEFTAIDLETTGLTPGKAEIIEAAGIRFNKSGMTLGTFSSLVKPGKALSPIAQKINGISESMVMNAPSLDTVLSQFSNFLEDSILIIQNSEFDLGFLICESQRRKIAFPTLPVFCTVQLTRKHFPEFKKYNLHFLREKFGISRRSQKFDPGTHFHEALDDSVAAMRVFLFCAEKGNLWEKEFSEVSCHPKGFSLTSDYNQNFRLF